MNCRVAIRVVLCACALTLGASQIAQAQVNFQTTTQSFNIGLEKQTTFVSVPATTNLARGAAAWSDYTGTLTFTFRVRTSTGGTGGTITLKGTSDFVGAASPKLANGDLSYVCATSIGTCTDGVVPGPAASAQTLVTIPPGACTGPSPCAFNSPDPNSVSLNLSLVNRPQFRTGTYTATLTFTISVT